MDALVEAPDINYIWALQETSAVPTADGYAQAAGQPGFTMFTLPPLSVIASATFCRWTSWRR